MGNSSGKEARGRSLSQSRSSEGRPGEPSTLQQAPSRTAPPQFVTGPPMYVSRANRGSRHDLGFFGLGASERSVAQLEQRRETKAEREARKLEREREARKQERERSIKEEGIDGGYLVTLGTYTGTEDFSKPVVRQLMIERRLAPFWKGLNDHSDSWTGHQLVAVVRGLPLPPADEIPPADSPGSGSPADDVRSTEANDAHLSVPLSSRSQSHTADTSANLSASHPAFSPIGPSPPTGSPPLSSSPFFKGRAKALAALKTSGNGESHPEMTQQEVQLPKDSHVNGQKLEAFLYKDASECPICFLYYPPYLNRTRCCDQPICSECFVQIKRPDPHPPEHHGEEAPAADDAEAREAIPEQENMLISEPAACPFCVQPEFGVTYEPPAFRRGLAYANQTHGLSLTLAASAMSSSSSLHSGSGTPGSSNRRRGHSLSANAPQVITTDRVRPDWAKKLSDARAHALRRAAAATALHNAAYVLGNAGSDSRGLLGRRRRMFANSGEGSGNESPSGRMPVSIGLGHVGAMLAAAERERERGATLPGGDGSEFQRGSSRRNRMEDLEELMMMEAIRLSLASEEERRRKEEKEAAKQAKKEQKQAEKDAKKAAKAVRKGSVGPFYSASANASTTSGLPHGPPEVDGKGKGKGVDRRTSSGYMTLQEPTSHVGDELAGPSSPTEDPQRHLEQSRAHLQSMPGDHSSSATTPAINISPNHRDQLRHLSNASSDTSSFNNSPSGSPVGGFGLSISHPDGDALHSETPPGGGAGTEPMFNFRSLAAVIGREDKDGAGHIEHATSPSSHVRLSPDNKSAADGSSPARSRGDSGESSSSSVAPAIAAVLNGEGQQQQQQDMVPLSKATTDASNPYDAKHFGDVSMLDMGAAGTSH